MHYDPTKVRVRDGWLVVLAFQRKKAVGLIHLPVNETGVEKIDTGEGRIVRVGEGKKNETIDLKAGQKIIYRTFLKHANPIPCDEKWEDGEEKRYFIMSSDDVVAISEEDVEVGVFSRPAMSAVSAVAEDGTVRMK